MACYSNTSQVSDRSTLAKLPWLNLWIAFLMNMDDGLLTGLSLIDFRKAFDLVDHGVLLREFAAYQLSKVSIQWFKSYLEGRLQSFHQWCDFQLLPVTSGVLQGSILGPLLFIIFINDLPLNVTNKSMYIYAFDTTQVVAGHVMEVASTLEEDLRNINKWAANNWMELNAEKTKSILIWRKPKHPSLAKKEDSLKITFHDQVIETVSSTKLL